MTLRALVFSLLFTASLQAASLPGIRLETIATTAGFVSSVAVDSRGTIYYTTTGGAIYRVDGTTSVKVATLPTASNGDAGLLGMSLIDDTTAAVHYTNLDLTREVISRVDLRSGDETVLASFINDITDPQRPVSAEHHGGNPTVAPDGSIFVAIGDFGGGVLAAYPEWNGGKIWRVYPDGTTVQFARGVRNMFDLAWDDANQRIVAGENGPVAGDEINVVHQGDDLGWPFTWGTQAPIAGATPPVYVFPDTVAPTGMLKLSGRNPMLRGYLFGAFVPAAAFLVPDIDVRPLPAPIALFDHEKKFVIDLAEGPSGEIIVATYDAINRLVLPQRGDCNGDGRVDGFDVFTLAAEVREGDGESIYAAADGDTRGSFGCDVNGDSLITHADVDELMKTVRVRTRAVRAR